MADLSNCVRKQTLAMAIALALCIGFIGGVVFAAYKLASPSKNKEQTVAGMNIAPSGQSVQAPDVTFKIREVEAYLANHPGDADAWTKLGDLFFDSDQFENSIVAYQKSLKISSGNKNVMTDMGVMYRRSNQPEKAIAIFDKVIEQDPLFESARFNKGVVLLHDLNNIQGAIRTWEDLVLINPLAMAPNGESVDAIVQRMKKQQLGAVNK